MEEKNANTKKSLTQLLSENGFVLPTTEEDLIEYQNRFGTTDIILPEEVDNPDFLFEKTPKPLTKKEKKKRSE